MWLILGLVGLLIVLPVIGSATDGDDSDSERRAVERAIGRVVAGEAAYARERRRFTEDAVVLLGRDPSLGGVFVRFDVELDTDDRGQLLWVRVTGDGHRRAEIRQLAGEPLGTFGDDAADR